MKALELKCCNFDIFFNESCFLLQDTSISTFRWPRYEQSAIWSLAMIIKRNKYLRAVPYLAYVSCWSPAILAVIKKSAGRSAISQPATALRYNR